tara:strand:+ start:3397 stop:3621 length:225 start_codon:yes stop_codon:yes gene_type:complete
MKNLTEVKLSNNLPAVGQRLNFKSAMFIVLAVNEYNVVLDILHKDSKGVSIHLRSEFTTLQNFALNYFGYKTNH